MATASGTGLRPASGGHQTRLAAYSRNASVASTATITYKRTAIDSPSPRALRDATLSHARRPAPHYPPRHGRLLRFRRAARQPRAARQAGGGGRLAAIARR